MVGLSTSLGPLRSLAVLPGLNPNALRQGVRAPRAGYVYLLGADGAYLLGADGAYLLGVAP